MKRALALMLALVLVLSLGFSVYATDIDGATDTTDTGSITITNAIPTHTYKVYKIFDAAFDKNSSDADGDGTKDIVTYTITETVNVNGVEVPNPIYTYIFGGTTAANGSITTQYFIYNTENGEVKRNPEATSDEAIFTYLTTMIRALDADGTLALQTVTATSKSVKFDKLDYGYYLIDKEANDDGTDVAVTITSNTPDINVVDKNLKPNVDGSFDKLVWDEDYVDPKTGEVGAWVENSTANVGDIVNWQIPFTATNYDGEYMVQYYSVRDHKTSSLWVEFNSIKITVDGNELTGLGYYWCAGDSNKLDTGDWSAAARPDIWTDDKDQASWYLIHYDYDEFEVVIPWLSNQTFTGTAGGYDLTFNLDKNNTTKPLSELLYPDSNTHAVVITYTASVGPDAPAVTPENSAQLDWHTIKGTFGPDESEKTQIKAYNLGITKIADDGTNTKPATPLGGAIFELYYDEACTKPIYVIPTGEEGVYILDDVATNVSGENRITSREKYTGKFETWIAEGTEFTTPTGVTVKVRNDVESPANGQLTILGLEAGDYWILETKAPDGYNLLNDAVKVSVGTGSTTPFESGYSVYNTNVVNKSGVELPSTGGKGTIMLITFGSMVAMAFAVLMITQKKMSIYND